MKHPIKMTSLAAAVMLTCGLTINATADQKMPATPHQAQVVTDATHKHAQEAKTAMQPKGADGMPATQHQKQALRGFDAADTNRDGNVTKTEFDTYMQTTGAKKYMQDLHAAEMHGVDESGPRDRHAADDSKHPLAEDTGTDDTSGNY